MLQFCIRKYIFGHISTVSCWICTELCRITAETSLLFVHRYINVSDHWVPPSAQPYSDQVITE